MASSKKKSLVKVRPARTVVEPESEEESSEEVEMEEEEEEEERSSPKRGRGRSSFTKTEVGCTYSETCI